MRKLVTQNLSVLQPDSQKSSLLPSLILREYYENIV